MTQFLSNFDQAFAPKEEFTDPVGKFRVSEPQALIDTDFELGPQLTKWENLAMTNNRPFAFNSAIPIKNFNTVTMPVDSRIVTVTLNTTTRTISAVTPSNPSVGYVNYTTTAEHGFTIGEYVNITGLGPSGYNGLFQIREVASGTTFAVQNTTTTTVTDASGTAVSNYAPPNGTVITITDTLLKNADGTYLIETGGGTNEFTYYAKSANKTGITAIYDFNKTSIFVATPYTASQIGGAPTMSYSGKLVTVTTTVPHGLALGNEVAISGTTASTHAPNGAWVVATVVSPTSFKVYVDDAPTGTLVATSAKVYVRPQATFGHRPHDGGVIFSANGNSNNQQAVRQTRRYFRYQSGKGIQYSSGSLLKPSYQLDELSCSGTVITIQTKESHNLLPGAEINIINAEPTTYNGTYTVDTVLSHNRFQVTTAVSLPDRASGRYYITVSQWTGAVNRIGLFDEQNGVFFEYDGNELYAVQRSSTYQLSGRVSVTNGSNTITQTSADFPTNFSRQIDPGNYIVLRGQSYKVLSIESDTSLTISPSYRGISSASVIVSKTFDKKYPQSEWNLDKMDGTGYSGYNVDLNRMQMFYIDYSWYGAGAIRWGMRGTNGEITYVHKLENNNLNLEAYMRSGNLPARYEAINETATSSLDGGITDADTTISLRDATDYPAASVTYPVYVMIDSEIIKYSGKSGNDLTGCTRNATFTQWVEGASRSFTGGPAASHTDNTGVILISNTCTPLVNHWGSSVIMDGNFDGDEGYQFTYNRSNYGLPATIGAKQVAFAMRLAPSVSNGIIGDLGVRDLINRAQLTLIDLNVQVGAGRYLIEGILNPNNIDSANTSWQGLNNSGGGFQPSFSQFSVAPRFTSESTGGLTGAPFNTTGGMSRSGVKVTTSGQRVYANLAPTNISSSGTGANLTVTLTAAGTAYNTTTTQISVQVAGTGYAVGDTIKILGNALGGSTTANDLTLTIQAITADINGGERLFAIPVSSTNQGVLNLSSVKQIGTSAVPGTGTFPNGPEVLAVQITALSTQSTPVGEIQLSFQESQA